MPKAKNLAVRGGKIAALFFGFIAALLTAISLLLSTGGSDFL